MTHWKRREKEESSNRGWKRKKKTFGYKEEMGQIKNKSMFSGVDEEKVFFFLEW